MPDHAMREHLGVGEPIKDRCDQVRGRSPVPGWLVGIFMVKTNSKVGRTFLGPNFFSRMPIAKNIF